VKVVAQPVPAAGRAREEALARLALRQSPGEPQLILRDGRPVVRLLAREGPQPAGRRIEPAEVHAIEVRRAVRAAPQPGLVGQDLQVPAHRRLRELQDLAQLGHPQLVPLQEPKEPQAGGIGQGLHPAEGLRQAGDGDGGKAALGTHH